MNCFGSALAGNDYWEEIKPRENYLQILSCKLFSRCGSICDHHPAIDAAQLIAVLVDLPSIVGPRSN